MADCASAGRSARFVLPFFDGDASAFEEVQQMPAVGTGILLHQTAQDVAIVASRLDRDPGAWSSAVRSFHGMSPPMTCFTMRVSFSGSCRRSSETKLFGTADIVFAAVAGSDEDSGVETAKRLARLDVDAFGMEGDLARHGDAGHVRAEIVAAGWQIEGLGEKPELPAREEMEFTLTDVVIGDGFSEVENGRCHGHWGWLRERGTGGVRQGALSTPAGSAPFRSTFRSHGDRGRTFGDGKS